MPFGDLQLASPTATRLYGAPTSITGPCSASSKPFETTVSLSADAAGDGVLTIGSENLGSWPYAIYATGASQLELVYSGSGSGPAGPYSATSTFTGYGASFSGNETLTIGGCTVTRPQSLTLAGSGLTLVASPAPSTGTGMSGPEGISAANYPCSTAFIHPCHVTGITLAGAPFNPVDGYVPQGTAEYKQLLALGFIPVSGECDEACVIEVQALLSSGQLKIGSSAGAAGVHLEPLGKARLKIEHGTASVELRFTKAGKKLLGEVAATSFKIELKLSASTPSGKSLGKTKIVYLHVARK